MENGSRALLMAAEVIVATMIITIGVYIFNEWGEYSKVTTAQITDTQIAEFNNQFLKYYGDRIEGDGATKPIKCTIHDVVSIANLAQKNNAFYQTTKDEYSSNSIYIRIDFKSNTVTVNNVEDRSQEYLIDLIKKHDLTTNADGEPEPRYFKVLEYKTSDMTKKVNYMKFVEMNPSEI